MAMCATDSVEIHISSMSILKVAIVMFEGVAGVLVAERRMGDRLVVKVALGFKIAEP